MIHTISCSSQEPISLAPIAGDDDELAKTIQQSKAIPLGLTGPSSPEPGTKKELSPFEREHRYQPLDHIQNSLAKQKQYALEAQRSQIEHPDFSAHIRPVILEKIKKIEPEEPIQVGSFEAGVCHDQGKRPTMEDEHLAALMKIVMQEKNRSIPVFGIFDGHAGPNAAIHVKENFIPMLEAQIKVKQDNFPMMSWDEIIWNALKLTFVELSECYNLSNQGHGGTTAIVVLIIENELWIANNGDSRAILKVGDRVLQLTEDMKPAQSTMPVGPLVDPQYFTHYTNRILHRGGTIIRSDDKDIPRISGLLAPGGAIGDGSISGVSARPKIVKINLTEFPPEEKIHSILCCDGVTDVLTTDEIGSLIQPEISCEQNAVAIVSSALSCHSGDNISCLVTRIK